MAATRRIRPKRTKEQTRLYEQNRKAKLLSLPIEERERRRLLQVEYDKRYYQRNQVKILNRKKAYQVENRESIVSKKVEYARNNRQKVNQISAACAHRRRASIGYLSVGDIRLIKEANDSLCCYCLKVFNYLELEHCTPLSRGGHHSEDNCTYACRKCNRTKSNKTVLEFLFDWPKVTEAYSTLESNVPRA